MQDCVASSDHVTSSEVMLKTMSVLLTKVRPQSPVYRRPYCPNMKARVSANPDGSPVGATNVNEASVTLVN